MKKLIKIILIFCVLFYGQSNAMQSKELKDKLSILKTNLGNLKDQLTTLNQKLGSLKNKLTGTEPTGAKPTSVTELADKQAFIRDKQTNHYNKTTLDDKAVKQGYGYKTANLMELQKLCQDNEGKGISCYGYKIQVPTIAGITSEEIVQFLEKYCKIDINDLWSKLIQKYFPNFITEQKQTLQTLFTEQKFPDKFLDELKTTIEESVSSKIKELNFASPEIFIQSFSPDMQVALTELFKQIGTNDRFMVRSTGREDTEELANAGGNESVANVQKEIKDILNAMAIVVSSYFSAKSMTQRLGARDPNLLDAPFTPVLFQKMVGETAQEKPSAGINTEERKTITRCGVMYTEEPEGSTYNINGKTSGLTLAQVSYGHNEGVVNSIVPVDSFYIDKDLDIHAIIRPKPFRLVPTTKKEQEADQSANNPIKKLKRADNTPAFANLETISNSAVKCLKFIADMLEAYYQKPMDVEFVIDEKTKTVYLVQTRPIPQTETDPASYLTIDFNTYKSNVIDAEVIVGAGGALKFISNDDQVIDAKTIGEALRIYQEPSIIKKDIFCVIIGENAPATSHEAATFRGEGKPVIYVKDFKNIDALLDQEDFRFVIDIQQGKIVNWAKAGFTEKSLDEVLAQSSSAVKGWFSYPTPKLISLYSERKINNWTDLPMTENVFGKQFKNEKLDDIAKHYKKTSKELSFNFFIQILKNKETQTQSEISWALRGMLHYLGSVTKKLNEAKFQSSEINLLNNFILYYSKRILDLWAAPKPNDLAFRMNYLFLVNKLEALIYQQPGDEIINGYSIAQILKALKEEKLVQSDIKKIAPAGKPDIYTIQLSRMGLYALTPEIKQDWLAFVLKVQSLRKADKADWESKNKLKLLVVKLTELGIAEMWLNTSFMQSKGQDAQARINKLFNEIFDEKYQLKPFLLTLNIYKQKIDVLNLEGVDDSASFLKVWNDFYENVLSYFIAEPFKQDFIAATTNIEKLAAVQLMEALVNKFDAAIKIMEWSDKYKFAETNATEDIKTVIDKNDPKIISTEIKDNKNRILTFSFMLYYYFELLHNWYNILESTGFASELSGYGKYPIKDVLSWDMSQLALTAPWGKQDKPQYKMGALLRNASMNTNSTDGVYQLGTTWLFNVNFSKIGSGIYYGMIFPKNDAGSFSVRLEDMFTTIHQSLLVIIGKITDKYGPDEANMPLEFKNACNAIKDTINKYTQLRTKKTNAITTFTKKLNNGKFKVEYSYAQKDHNSTIKMAYEKIKNNEILKIAFVTFGQDQFARFEILDDIAEVLSDLYKLGPINIKPYEDTEIKLSWKINDKVNFESISKNIATCIFFLSEIESLRYPEATISFLLDNTVFDRDTKKQIKYPIMELFQNSFTDKIIEKIIDLSANSNKNRIYWPLKEILLEKIEYVDKETNNLTHKNISKSKQFNFDSVKEPLKTILKNIGNLETPYAKKSMLYLDRQRLENKKYSSSDKDSVAHKHEYSSSSEEEYSSSSEEEYGAAPEDLDKAKADLQSIVDKIKQLIAKKQPTKIKHPVKTKQPIKSKIKQPKK